MLSDRSQDMNGEPCRVRIVSRYEINAGVFQSTQEVNVAD